MSDDEAKMLATCLRLCLNMASSIAYNMTCNRYFWGGGRDSTRQTGPLPIDVSYSNKKTLTLNSELGIALRGCEVRTVICTFEVNHLNSTLREHTVFPFMQYTSHAHCKMSSENPHHFSDSPVFVLPSHTFHKSPTHPLCMSRHPSAPTRPAPSFPPSQI